MPDSIWLRTPANHRWPRLPLSVLQTAIYISLQ